MRDFSKAHNELLDAHDHHTEEIHRIKMKLVDLKDRSRRNNIKFRGIPESVEANELTPHVQQLISTQDCQNLTLTS